MQANQYPARSVEKVFQKINMMQGNTEVCWPWTGSLNASDGRPYVTINGIRRPAYVWTVIFTTGQLPDGRVVRHKCDNPVCCNPMHLEWGTQQENMEDMKERERHGLPAIVKNAMKKLSSSGVSQAEIADRYGVSQQAVSQILQRSEDNEREGEEGTNGGRVDASFASGDGG